MKTDINTLRQLVYASYEDVLAGREQREISIPGTQIFTEFPEFETNGWLIYWSGNIEDSRFKGRNYLLGQEKKYGGQMLPEIKGMDKCFVVETKKGVRPFEAYSQREFRPVFFTPDERTLIIDLSTLREKRHKEHLEGHSPEDVANINLEKFLKLRAEHCRMPEEEYKEFYLDLWANNPILF